MALPDMLRAKVQLWACQLLQLTHCCFLCPKLQDLQVQALAQRGWGRIDDERGQFTRAGGPER